MQNLSCQMSIHVKYKSDSRFVTHVCFILCTCGLDALFSFWIEVYQMHVLLMQAKLVAQNSETGSKKKVSQSVYVADTDILS